MNRHTLVDLNPVEPNYYPLNISLDECNRSCNAVDDLFTKICVQSKKKDVSIKVFNLIISRNETETLVKHVSGKVTSIAQHVIHTTNEIMIHGSASGKVKISANCKYLKSIVDNSVIICDEIINAANSVSTNVTNTIRINATIINQPM